MRNKRDVWEIATQPFPDAHFAVMPEALAEPCILAGSRVGDLVLDPFGGAGTTAVVAKRHGRDYLLCELNAKFIEIAERRIGQVVDVREPLMPKAVDHPSLFAEVSL